MFGADLDVLDFGQPIALLTWFLQTYAEGLPQREKKRFLKKRVKDLIQPMNNLITEAFVTQLKESIKTELASCNYMIATKKHTYRLRTL